jgi:hypothetical protein
MISCISLPQGHPRGLGGLFFEFTPLCASTRSARTEFQLVKWAPFALKLSKALFVLPATLGHDFFLNPGKIIGLTA